MEGIKLNFTSNEISIDPTSKVTGFDATVQNALVNIGTRAGTDFIFPDKGTLLLKRAVEGKIVGLNAANHASQIAALDTLFFSREYETSSDPALKLGKVSMAPVSYDGTRLKINVAFTNLSASRTVGVETNL